MADQTAIAWLTEPQALEITGRTRRTLQMWRASGQVVAHKQSRALTLYEAASLRECADRQEARYALSVGRPRTR